MYPETALVLAILWCGTCGIVAWCIDRSGKAVAMGIIGGPVGLWLVLLMVRGAELVKEKLREPETGLTETWPTRSGPDNLEWG